MEKHLSDLKRILPYILIFSGLCLYYGFVALSGILTNQFKTFTEMMPIIIVSNLPFFFFRYAYSWIYIKAKSFKSYLTFLCVVAAVLVFALICFLLNTHYYFANFATNYFQTLYVIVLFLVFSSATAFGFFLLNNVRNVPIAVAGNKKMMPQHPKAYQRLLAWLSIYGAAFMFGDGVLAVFRIYNFAVSPFVFTGLILYCFGPAVMAFDYLFVDGDKKKAIWAAYWVNVFTLLLGQILYFAASSEVLKVGQNLFVNSFATSLPVGQILSFVAQVVLLVFIDIAYFKEKKARKEQA